MMDKAAMAATVQWVQTLPKALLLVVLIMNSSDFLVGSGLQYRFTALQSVPDRYCNAAWLQVKNQ